MPKPPDTAPRINLSSVLTGFALGAVVTALAFIQLVPVESAGQRPVPLAGGFNASGLPEAVDDQAGQLPSFDIDDVGGDAGPPQGLQADSSGEGGASAGGSGGLAGGPGGASGAGAGGAECAAGKNGGDTDTGVSATEIKLGATVAETGIAQAFLGEVRQAMEAVKNKINRAGGICGRQIVLETKEDGWSPDRGKSALENLIEQEKVFALAVSPSSEGVNQASLAGLFEKAGVPVVGTDGMIRTQYTDPMIWPVAASTTTAMHVAMKDAWDRGARKPAIVFENTFRFGVEGAHAFNKAFERLNGSAIPGSYDPTSGGSGACNGRFCGIEAGRGQYGAEVAKVNEACSGGKCDFLVMLLEPKTAQDWMAVPGAPAVGSYDFGIGVAQPLFTRDFGRECGDKCDGMWVWTGYNPPIEQYAPEKYAPSRQYVDDLSGQSASADRFNQFTEGGYIGMTLVIEALKKVGPNLTRKALIEALDTMTLDTGLAPKLTWQKGRHFANPAAQAYRFNSKNGFTGWSPVKGYVDDPWLGQDAG